MKHSKTIPSVLLLAASLLGSIYGKSQNSNSVAPLLAEIPVIATDYVLIYKPQPDVFSLKDTKNYKQGQTYSQWQPNDHTFIKGPDNRWHCFGITRPNDVSNDGVHEGEGLCFHAVAPAGSLSKAFLPKSWKDGVKIDVAGAGQAPCAIKIENTYSLISTNKGQAVSTDLYNWKDNGKLAINSGNRDPNIMYWNGTYYLVRCNNRSVVLVTSKDFVHWTEPIDIFVAPNKDWDCESPILMQHKGIFYLFWCLWDRAGSGAELPALYDGHNPKTYDYRTFVYASETPLDFNHKEPITQLKAHAPEIIHDEKGNYFISSADYPNRGINLARLEWKSGKSKNQTKQ